MKTLDKTQRQVSFFLAPSKVRRKKAAINLFKWHNKASYINFIQFCGSYMRTSYTNLKLEFSSKRSETDLNYFLLLQNPVRWNLVLWFMIIVIRLLLETMTCQPLLKKSEGSLWGHVLCIRWNAYLVKTCSNICSQAHHLLAIWAPHESNSFSICCRSSLEALKAVEALTLHKLGISILR